MNIDNNFVLIGSTLTVLGVGGVSIGRSTASNWLIALGIYIGGTGLLCVAFGLDPREPLVLDTESISED